MTKSMSASGGPLLDPLPATWLWQSAAAIAAEAHEGQHSPGSSMPYFAHPGRVALLVSAVFGCHDPEVLAAALLHDVLEKTTVSREGLAIAMGSKVAAWVEWLSKTTKDEKASYWQRLTIAPWQVRMIKIADALDHLNGPAEYRQDRLKSARKALALASSDEAPLRQAAATLRDAIAALEDGASGSSE